MKAKIVSLFNVLEELGEGQEGTARGTEEFEELAPVGREAPATVSRMYGGRSQPLLRLHVRLLHGQLPCPGSFSTCSVCLQCAVAVPRKQPSRAQSTESLNWQTHVHHIS